MNWTTGKELKQQAFKLWEKGVFLTALLTDEPLFPLKLKLTKPNSADITERLPAVRQWSEALKNVQSVQILWKTVKHRVQGEQQIPDQVFIENIDTLLAWLNKKKDYQCFVQLISQTQSEPQLLPWLAKYPFKALELAADWQRLLSIVVWRKARSNPQIYLRQIDLPQVHSKFIEQHRAVLAELFDLSLPSAEIRQELTGIAHFAERYGFLTKPTHIRLRNLDKNTPLVVGTDYADVSFDSHTFSCLQPDIQRLFIVENEINFLTFPQVPHSWAIFGAGYGWSHFVNAQWLNRCQIYYWGDIDTHGFAILNQLRYYFPHAVSFLMDEATLLAHQTFFAQEAKPGIAQLERLTAAEQQLYQDLQQHRFGERLRLEQELISFEWMENALIHILNK